MKNIKKINTIKLKQSLIRNPIQLNSVNRNVNNIYEEFITKLNQHKNQCSKPWIDEELIQELPNWKKAISRNRELKK